MKNIVKNSVWLALLAAAADVMAFIGNYVTYGYPINLESILRFYPICLAIVAGICVAIASVRWLFRVEDAS